MRINITQFIRENCMRDYSASVAEIGENAGADTWRAACEDSADNMLLDTEEKRDAFRAFVRSSGGWTEDEIAAWSDTELNALFLQWVAGDWRECIEWPDVDDIWANYEELAQAGTVPSNIWRDDVGNIYYSLNN